MALVTVCIPAYRSGTMIVPLLTALREQTFGDFAVEIALEPVDPEPTLQACLPFLADPRFRLRINPEQLGWDANIRAMLRRVRTPMFMIQPHDDVITRDYLELLVGALEARPEASTAYTDIFLFGNQGGRRGTPIPDGSMGRQLLAFLLDGANGFLFRGVSRSRLLDREFPTNPVTGLLVETIWAQHQVVAGPVIHLDKARYYRRAQAATGTSVTGTWRSRMPLEELARGIEHNRESHLAGIPAEVPGDVPRELIVLAAEAAALRRWTTFSAGRAGFSGVQLERARRILAVPPTDPDRRRMVASIHVAMSHHHLATDDPEAALASAEAAVAIAPDDQEACLQLGRILDPAGNIDLMVDLLERALRSGPVDPVVRSLMERVDEGLVAAYGPSPT